jgi:neutral trehalase
MAWAVWQNYKWSGDRDYLEHAYSVLKDYNRWLYKKRRHCSGLFFWKHPFESGIDNASRFTDRGATRHADMKSLAAIDLSSYMVLQNESLAGMADEFGRAAEAKGFRDKAQELRRLINEKLWDHATGLYYDRDMKADTLIRIKNIASLLPLFCGVPDGKRAARMRDHIMDPEEFNTPMPLPSVARDEPTFFLDMWRGPVWINTSYMVILGLEQYGFREEAAQIAFRTVDWVYKNRAATGEFWEFFDPEQVGIDRLHRKTRPKKVGTMDDKPRPRFVGWTGLVNNLVAEHLIGLRKGEEGWEVCPRLPEQAHGMTFRLSIRLEYLEVREDGKYAGKIKSYGNVRDIDQGGCQRF